MKSESVKKGDTIEVDCTASGDSSIDIKWIKEDRVIEEQKDRFQ
jgi:hypothetical protein